MEVQFLGGASEVGRLAMLLRHKGANLLFDYGMLPEDPPQYPMQAPPVDMTFLSHAHLDHCGMIPWVGGRYDTGIVATPATFDTADVLLKDSLKVTRLEGLPEPFDEEDLRNTRRNYRDARFGSVIEAAALEITLHSAGHIPGSTMFEINGPKTVVFTGDLQTINTELMWGAHPLECDVLIVESTYAGKTHPDRETTEREFLAKVREVNDRGGVAIVPSFAVARTQEMLLTLARENFEVWIDGMGKLVNKVYLQHPDFLRNVRKLRDAMGKTNVVRPPRGRDRALQGDAIVCTSGMLDGGPALWYLAEIAKDSRHAILLTGYQVDGTNGRMLLESGRVEIDGTTLPIQCEVQRYDFSAHAGHEELLSFIDQCDPQKVVLMHGDNREALAKDLPGKEVVMPMEGQWYEI